jgi:hypothetical protein
MRINKPLKVHKWWPVAHAMPNMLKELAAQPQAGMRGGEMWFGRTTIMVQYWRTMAQLMPMPKTSRPGAHEPRP